MFVVTIGPLSKHWGRILKVLAIGVVLLLIALVAWKLLGSMGGAVPDEPQSAGQVLATFGRNLGSGWWNRFLYAIQQWLSYGF